MTQTLEIFGVDDFHLHLREGVRMVAVAQDAARTLGRALVMPNLKTPVATTEQVLLYRQQILDATQGSGFEPLMSLYLTKETTVAELRKAKESGVVYAVKLYPQGATTLSNAGVHDITSAYPLFAEMEALGLVLAVHGEVTDPSVDIFDREAVFLEKVLSPIVAKFPGLKVVLEHVTTAEGVDFIKSQGPNIAGTLTAHHLRINRNHLLVGGIKPHLYCLPIVKRQSHQEALVKAAVSGSLKFFMGTDSAPHAQGDKESACGCAGVYTGFAPLTYYAEVFEQQGALGRLQAFVGHFGADFYGIDRGHRGFLLTKEPCLIPKELSLGPDRLVPFEAGKELSWSQKSIKP